MQGTPWKGVMLDAACASVPEGMRLAVTTDGHVIVAGQYGRAIACSTSGGFAPVFTRTRKGD